MTPSTVAKMHIAEEEFQRLHLLAATSSKSGGSAGAAAFLAELNRATVLPRQVLPPGVVTVNSRVRFKDVESGDVEAYIITWPDRADGGVERISVLAPIGTALLGYRQGDEISWPTPGGTRRLQILEVEPWAEKPPVEENQDVLTRLLSGHS